MKNADDENRRPVWNYAAILGIAFLSYWLYATDGCSKPFELPRFSNGSKEKPVALPEDARLLIKASASHFRGTLSADVYNGTDWNVTRVDLNVTKSPHGPKTETRRFQLGPAGQLASSAPSKGIQIPDSIAKPFSTTKFDAQIGDFFPQAADYLPDVKDTLEWEFTIMEAYGYKE